MESLKNKRDVSLSWLKKKRISNENKENEPLMSEAESKPRLQLTPYKRKNLAREKQKSFEKSLTPYYPISMRSKSVPVLCETNSLLIPNQKAFSNVEKSVRPKLKQIHDTTYSGARLFEKELEIKGESKILSSINTFPNTSGENSPYMRVRCSKERSPNMPPESWENFSHSSTSSWRTSPSQRSQDSGYSDSGESNVGYQHEPNDPTDNPSLLVPEIVESTDVEGKYVTTIYLGENEENKRTTAEFETSKNSNSNNSSFNKHFSRRLRIGKRRSINRKKVSYPLQLPFSSSKLEFQRNDRLQLISPTTDIKNHEETNASDLEHKTLQNITSTPYSRVSNIPKQVLKTLFQDKNIFNKSPIKENSYQSPKLKSILRPNHRNTCSRNESFTQQLDNSNRISYISSSTLQNSFMRYNTTPNRNNSFNQNVRFSAHVQENIQNVHRFSGDYSQKSIYFSNSLYQFKKCPFEAARLLRNTSVTQWLTDLKLMGESECLNTLQSKSLPLAPPVVIAVTRDRLVNVQRKAHVVSAEFALLCQRLEQLNFSQIPSLVTSLVHHVNLFIESQCSIAILNSNPFDQQKVLSKPNNFHTQNSLNQPNLLSQSNLLINKLQPNHKVLENENENKNFQNVGFQQPTSSNFSSKSNVYENIYKKFSNQNTQMSYLHQQVRVVKQICSKLVQMCSESIDNEQTLNFQNTPEISKQKILEKSFDKNRIQNRFSVNMESLGKFSTAKIENLLENQNKTADRNFDIDISNLKSEKQKSFTENQNLHSSNLNSVKVRNENKTSKNSRKISNYENVNNNNIINSNKLNKSITKSNYEIIYENNMKKINNYKSVTENTDNLETKNTDDKPETAEISTPRICSNFNNSDYQGQRITETSSILHTDKNKIDDNETNNTENNCDRNSNENENKNDNINKRINNTENNTNNYCNDNTKLSMTLSNNHNTKINNYGYEIHNNKEESSICNKLNKIDLNFSEKLSKKPNYLHEKRDCLTQYSEYVAQESDISHEIKNLNPLHDLSVQKSRNTSSADHNFSRIIRHQNSRISENFILEKSKSISDARDNSKNIFSQKFYKKKCSKNKCKNKYGRKKHNRRKHIAKNKNDELRNKITISNPVLDRKSQCTISLQNIEQSGFLDRKHPFRTSRKFKNPSSIAILNPKEENTKILIKKGEIDMKIMREFVQTVTAFGHAFTKLVDILLTHGAQFLVNTVSESSTMEELKACVMEIAELAAIGTHVCRILSRVSGVEMLLSLCVDEEISEIRSLVLRALATVCCVSDAVKCFIKDDGLEIIASILSNLNVNEEEKSEAAGVLAQITSPWLEKNEEFRPYFLSKMRYFVTALTNLAESTHTSEVFLLSSAAIANLTYLDHRCIEFLLDSSAQSLFIQTVANNPNISIFTKDQIATILSNMTNSCEATQKIIAEEGIEAFVNLLHTEIHENLSQPETEAAERILQKSAIALSRISNQNPSMIEKQMIDTGALFRLVQLCKDERKRNNSDSVLVACLAAVRKISTWCDNEKLFETGALDLIEPRLLDSFLIYSSQEESIV